MHHHKAAETTLGAKDMQNSHVIDHDANRPHIPSRYINVKERRLFRVSRDAFRGGSFPVRLR
jgi:hypothetical protein